jgi:patatin-related protein
MREMRTVLEAARPQIDKLVSEIIGNTSPRTNGARAVQRWREEANALSAKQAHYAYQVYARLKAGTVLEHLIGLACELAELDKDSPRRAVIAAAIHAWAARSGAIPPQGVLPAAGSVDGGSHPAPWIDFLLHFDIDFRRRRGSFMVRGLNQLYSRLEEPGFRGVAPEQIDDLKHRFQRPLSRLRMLRSGEFAYPGIRARLVALAAALDGSANHAGAHNPFADKSLADRIDDIMSQLSDELDLKSIDRELDDIAGSFLTKTVPQAFRHEMLLYFVGFSFWDVLTFTLPEWRDIGEHDEIRVDRISPADAVSVRMGTANSALKGAELRHFAGFLSRSLRESDYLWGRLDGAERLIDIVCDAAGADFAPDPVDVKRIKTLTFRSILEAEEKHLHDKSLVPTIRAAIDAVSGTAATSSSQMASASSTPRRPLLQRASRWIKRLR